MAERVVQVAQPSTLTVGRLHDILRLRVDVFVVDQQCAYAEIDGLDLNPNTRHLWIEADCAPASSSPLAVAPTLSYVRIIDADGGHRQLGRVVTRPEAQGRGLAARLVTEALGRESTPLICEAQSHLREWYEALGFVVTGEEFVEDGIPHLPMIHSPAESHPERDDSGAGPADRPTEPRGIDAPT